MPYPPKINLTTGAVLVETAGVDSASGATLVRSVDSSGNNLSAVKCVTATGVAAAAVTLTIPAVAAKFHFITSIQVVKFATALLTAAATPVLVTTTNLDGTPALSFTAAASAAGTSEIQQFEPAEAIRSAVVNTNTTIVCPATTATIWRVNVFYRESA